MMNVLQIITHLCSIEYASLDIYFILLNVSETPAMTLIYIDNKNAYLAANKIQI